MHFLNYKHILTTLFFGIGMFPLILFAQPATGDIPRAIIVDEQNAYLPASIQTSQAFGQTGNTQYGIDAGRVASSYSQCISTSIVSNGIKSAITNIVGSGTDLIRVPVNNPVQEAKEVGLPVNVGSPVTAGISWDQTGWCIANALIESLSIATVSWINSGFEGNPAFVEDPAQFFGDIADVQAGIFLNELTGGLFCTPIQDLVRINIAQSYNSSISPYGDRASCTFSGVSGSLEQFMSGESFSWDDWISYTQNPYNNPYGATVYGQIELAQRISTSIDIQSKLLDWGSGFLSKKDEKGNIVSPGAVIENQINQRLFSGQRRLEIADEFNEIVDALVGQLIRVAVSEVTQIGQ